MAEANSDHSWRSSQLCSPGPCAEHCGQMSTSQLGTWEWAGEEMSVGPREMVGAMGASDGAKE